MPPANGAGLPLGTAPRRRLAAEHVTGGSRLREQTARARPARRRPAIRALGRAGLSGGARLIGSMRGTRKSRGESREMYVTDASEHMHLPNLGRPEQPPTP